MLGTTINNEGKTVNKPNYLFLLSLIVLAVVSPPVTAIGVTYLAPGWSSDNFLTLSTPSRAIEFDAAGNLFIEDTTDDGQGTVEIVMLDASTGYSSSTIYATYSSSYYGVTGLDFDDLGNMYISERDTTGDAGIIRVVDVTTQSLIGDLMAFANHRPTGIDADVYGNVFYTGRRESDGLWGKVYSIDSTVNRTVLIDDTVGTGIAVDAFGNIFMSTPQRTDLPLLANSIYMFNPADLLNPILIATFDQRGGELTFDADGNLYIVGEDQVSIVRLTAVPVPPALLLFSSGLIGLIGFVRMKTS